MKVVITGHPVTAAAWSFALEQLSLPSVVLTEEEVEAAFLAGLKQMLLTQIARGAISAGASLTKLTV
jgi:hypothetical protein